MCVCVCAFLVVFLAVTSNVIYKTIVDKIYMGSTLYMGKVPQRRKEEVYLQHLQLTYLLYPVSHCEQLYCSQASGAVVL